MKPQTRFTPAIRRLYYPLSFSVMLATTLMLLLLGARPSAAQTGATIRLAPPATAAGGVFAIVGSGFTPGGYAGTVLWDGEPIDTFPIPKEGFFTHYVAAPPFAAYGEHKVTVCAGDPCFGGESAQEASQTLTIVERMPVFNGQIAIVYAPGIYNDVPVAVLQIRELIESYGPTVVLVKQADAAKIDFSGFALTIIASNTGSLAEWGTDAQVAQIARSNRILGLGNGGYAFFGKLKLPIGYPNAAHGQTNSATIANPQLIFSKTPHHIGIDAQQSVPLYEQDTQTVLLPADANDFLPLAFGVLSGDPSGRPVVANQGCRTLWGFDGGPAQMTPLGRAFFANAIYFAMSTGCNFEPRTYCAPLSSPAAIPSARHIDFDDLKDRTVIGETYTESHGVLFEEGRLTQAVIYSSQEDEERSPQTPPNVALNLDNSGNGSSNIPMRIEFDRDLSMAGAWLGNGADLTAIVRAYDRSGEPVCATASPIEAAHTTFVGIYDALGRIARLEIDYGDSPLNESIDNLTFGPALFADTILLCHTNGNGCDPLANEPVHWLRNGRDTGTILYSDANGYLVDRGQVQFGDALWPMAPISATDSYTLYLTTHTPVSVSAEAFQPGAMTVAVDDTLVLFNLDVSAQWDMTFDTAYQAELVARIVQASNHLYDFSDGQMAFGDVTIRQHYDGWEDADIRLYASNVFRPKAAIGGIVSTATADPLVTDHSYYPGYLYMGSTWNRYGTPDLPIGQRINEDWALALAHELGHYALFLYDTYLGLGEDGTYVEIDTCTGSAMGWAYEEMNTEFVFDEPFWAEACGTTLANQVLQRTEWATIQLWYANMLVTPAVVDPGPQAPPIPLTNVRFVPPSTPVTPLSNQTYALNYADDEVASADARAILIRDQRLLDEGRPVSGTTTMTLTGAGIGDRFCLYDIGPNPGDRRQFGCETIGGEDNVLVLEKDVTWAPMVEVTLETSRTVAISVTQPMATGQNLRATLYPEDANAATTIDLNADGELHTGVFDSPVPALGAYIIVNVDEPATDTDPQRGALIEYGTGGSGAYGPASRLGGVPIVSGDGQAEFALSETTTLANGEFISWQSMASSPSTASQRRTLGRSYKLLALPPSLAEQGTVSIRLPDTPAPTSRAAAQEGLSVHFWTGEEWIPLASTLAVDPQGGGKIMAPSQGVGIYALLEDASGPGPIYVPIVAR